MNRTTGIVGTALGCALGFLGVGIVTEDQAAACGGCFHPPTQVATDITDERMLLAVSPAQSTLYDQIEYTGNPTSFAWVLPIHGTVDVGLSADVLFDSIDVLTATQIVAPVPNCPSPNCRSGFGAPQAAAGGASNGAATVTVTKQENVGPYATVQLHSTDSGALEAWLSQNGFMIPSDVQPVVTEYIAEGFDFLAMKLLPNQGIQAMRPVRVTTQGASLSLPLRMASVGTGVQVGITIWVVSDGRYEPQNFTFFHIDDSELVWDWSTNSSNYATLRAQHETALKNAGWELESSITLNETLISNVILNGGQYYGGGFAPATASDATQDYLPVTANADAGVEAGAGESADQVRADDIATLFTGIEGPSVRVTRMRSDIAHAAMTKDFVLQASADQSEVSNVRNVTQSVNLQCPLYNGCSQVGTGSPAQAAASIAKTDSSGCATLPAPRGGRTVAFASLVWLLGLFWARRARSEGPRPS